VLAQRLVRRICAHCRVEDSASAGTHEKLLAAGALRLEGRYYRGAGCEECRGSGYRGRVGIFELLVLNARLRELILKRCSSAEIKAVARESMKTMQEDALAKAAEGLTTLDEVVRVVSGELQE
jgi:type II secretory ATPase GspE/PulE/Tfp pilus assembly ATPase PilB-like protein